MATLEIWKLTTVGHDGIRPRRLDDAGDLREALDLCDAAGPGRYCITDGRGKVHGRYTVFLPLREATAAALARAEERLERLMQGYETGDAEAGPPQGEEVPCAGAG